MKKIISLLLLVTTLSVFAGPPIILNPTSSGLYRQTPWLSDWSSCMLTNTSWALFTGNWLGDAYSQALFGQTISNILGTNYATQPQLLAASNAVISQAVSQAVQKSGTNNPSSWTTAAGVLVNTNAAAFCASNYITDPQVYAHLNAYWNYLAVNNNTQWLLDGLDFGKRFNPTTSSLSLRGNPYTWNNPVFDPSGFWGAINATSTVSFTLPNLVSNVIVVETWRSDVYTNGTQYAFVTGTLFRLSETNSYSSEFLHTAGGTYGICENNTNTLSLTGYNSNYFVPFGESQAGGNVTYQSANRMMEGKTTAVARTAGGVYQLYQDGIPVWTLTSTNGNASTFTNNWSPTAYSQVPFNRVDIGIDTTNASQKIQTDLNLGAVHTNFYIASVQLVTFTNASQIFGLVQFFTGAADYLNIPGWQVDTYYGDSTIGTIGLSFPNLGTPSTNDWPHWLESWQGNYNYHNEAYQGETFFNFLNYTIPGQILNELSVTPPGFQNNVFISFNNDLSGSSYLTTYGYLSNSLTQIYLASPTSDRVWRDCMIRWTNGTSAYQQTNTIAFDSYVESFPPYYGTVPLITHAVAIDPYLTQFMYNTNNGYSGNGYHLMQDGTNSVLTQWQARLLAQWPLGILQPAPWPYSIPYSPSYNGSNWLQ